MEMILIKDAYKHLNKDKYDSRKKRIKLNTRIRRLIENGIIEGNLNEKNVNLYSLLKHYKYEKNIEENYIEFREFLRLLNIVTSTSAFVYKRSLDSLGSSNPFEYIYTEYPIKGHSFFISKESYSNFRENYIAMDDVKKKIDKGENWWWTTLKSLNVKPIQFGIRRFIKKEEYKLILEEENTVFDNPDYYSLEQVMHILSITLQKDIVPIENDYKVFPFKYKGRWKYYNKQDIDNLKKKQNELRRDHLTYREILDFCTERKMSFQSSDIKSKPVDSLVRPFIRNVKRMYSKRDLEKWIEERKNHTLYYSVEMGSNYETFQYRLNLKKVDVKYLGKFTSETWFQFVKRKLDTTTANKQSTNSAIKRLIYCTQHIIDLLRTTNKKEIYSLSSNDINTLFNEIPKKDARILYVYFKRSHSLLLSRQIKSYDLSKLNHPLNFSSKSKEKTIYDYDLYKKLYIYTKDISYHKEGAIKDAKDLIARGNNDHKRIKFYASSWLYVLLHLNNAWRHTDIIAFPQVSLNGTKILDLDWILQNELNESDADYILGQVYNSEFIISKTQVKNHFFYSNDLKIPLATAIAICQLIISSTAPLRESIIDFGSKKQNFSETRQAHFFKGFSENDFYFSSRTMNRSLLSYVHTVLSKLNRGSIGINTIQKMRGHLSNESTNLYVDIPESELNFITQQLFSRGSFGFIYDLFLDILKGVEVDRDERTIEISYLKKYFGDFHKVEQISEYLNVIQSDRKSILDRILSMGLNETQKWMHKIETNQLPSKMENVQCLVAEEGCIKTQGVSCFDCAYSIPNYYALSTLGSSLQQRLNNYIQTEEDPSSTSFYEKRKQARLFYIQLESFAQAVEKFGPIVYQFIQDTREDFISKQSLISSLDEKYQLL